MYSDLNSLVKAVSRRSKIYFDEQSIATGNEARLRNALKSLPASSLMINRMVDRFPSFDPEVRVKVAATVAMSSFIVVGETSRMFDLIVELAKGYPHFVSHIRYAYRIKRGYLNIPHIYEGNAPVFEFRHFTEKDGWTFANYLMVMQMWGNEGQHVFRQDLSATSLGPKGFDGLFNECKDPYLLDWAHSVR